MNTQHIDPGNGQSPHGLAPTDDLVLAVPTLSVVIPLRDEQPTLEALFESIKQSCETSGLTFEVIFVDDGSQDGSLETMIHLARQDNRVRPIALPRNFGKAAALSTGFREARGRYVVTMDGDLQHDPAEIPHLLEVLQQGYGLVSGWKRDRKDHLSRRIASRLFNWATRRLSHVELHDFNCGLKAYTRECAQSLAEVCYGELHRYLPVLANYRGYRVTEIEVNHRERTNGRSRYGLERYFRGFLDLLTATFLSRYARRPMHVFGGIGLALFLPGSVTLGWLVVDKVAFGATIGNRPALVLGAVLALAGLQLMVAGLVAELITGPRSSTVPHTVIVAMPDESPDATDRSPVVVSHPSTPRWGARPGHGQDPR